MKELTSYRPVSVSVVIPAFNEQAEIGRCLESLGRQTYQDFEVIVVDNGSTDDTALIAESFGVRVVTEPRRGIASARQAGFEAAQGSIIASTDADTVVPPNWVERIEEAFREGPEAVAVFGPFRYRSHSAPRPFVNRIIPYCSSGLAVGQRVTFRLGLPHFPGSNFAVRREAFFQVGGFRSPMSGRLYSYWEDVQLGMKLNRIGEVRYLPDLVVTASARKLRSFKDNVIVPARKAAVLHVLGRDL